MRCHFLLLPLTLVAVLSAGCRTHDFRTEADQLRGRIAEMEREMQQIERRNRELRAELERQARIDGVPEEVAAHTPRTVELVFARFSHARDTSGDGVPDELRLYLQPRDGRGRFVQVAGELTVTATLVPRDPQQEPITIGTITLGPEDVRDAYRSGFMGTHYSTRMPVTIPAELADSLSAADLDRVLVRAVLADGLTGQTFTADRMLELRH